MTPNGDNSDKMIFPWNINNAHWVVVLIDFQKKVSIVIWLLCHTTTFVDWFVTILPNV